MLKPGLAALERGRRSLREQMGRTAIAYVVLALLLTGSPTTTSGTTWSR